MRRALSVGLFAGILALTIVPMSMTDAQPRDAGARIRGDVGQAARSPSRTRPSAYSAPSSRAVRREAAPGVETAYSRIPLPFVVGDRVVVARDSARLMRGRDVIGAVPAGEQLRVVQIRGPWVGVAATIAGREVGGWLWYSQVAAADAAASPDDAER